MFINSLILYFNKKVNLGHIYLPTLIKGFHIKMCSLTNPVVNEKGEAKATVESVDFSYSLTSFSRGLRY